MYAGFSDLFLYTISMFRGQRTLTIYRIPLNICAPFFCASIFCAPLTFHNLRPSNFRAACPIRAPFMFAHPKIFMKIFIMLEVISFHILINICMVYTTRTRTRGQWIAQVEELFFISGYFIPIKSALWHIALWYRESMYSLHMYSWNGTTAIIFTKRLPLFFAHPLIFTHPQKPFLPLLFSRTLSAQICSL